MSKAEERALEAYPKATRDIGGIVVDIGHPQYTRDLYIEGYRQAEKDLELSWEDIDKIGNLFNECMSKLEKENSGYADYGVPSKVLAQEVLKAFYEQKQQ